MELKSIKVRGLKYQHLIRAAKNLKIFDLILTSKFEVFEVYPKKTSVSETSIILNLKNAVLILTLNFEVSFEDPQKT